MQNLFTDPKTGKEYSLEDILAGYQAPKRPQFHPGISHRGSWREWNAYERNLVSSGKKYREDRRAFDALQNLGTGFSSGLKLKKPERKFASGMSSLFIQ